MIFSSPFIFLYDLFFKKIFPRTRLWLSYSRKRVARLRTDEDIELQEIVVFKPQSADYDVPNTKLIQVLNIEHLLLTVVEYMHNGDVVNLGLTCRAVREAVYPSNDLGYRVPKLLKYSRFLLVSSSLF